MMQESIETVTNPSIVDEARTRLFAVLDYLGEVGKKTADFAGEQLPLVAQDIVTYGVVSNWIYSAIGLLSILVAVFLIASLWRKGKEWNDSMNTPDPSPKVVFAVIGTILFFLNGLIMFSTHIDDAVKATFAPRVYLIEYVANTLEKMNR